MVIFPLKWLVLFNNGDRAIIYSDPMHWPAEHIDKICCITPIYN